MKILLKSLNPLIALINFFNYYSHLESQRYSKNSEYERYDFSQDIKYF